MSVAQLDVALDRPLPQSTDAERAVLGSVLINNNAFYRVIGTIDTEDFFKDSHRTIFSTMRRLAEGSREIDLATVDFLMEHLDAASLLVIHDLRFRPGQVGGRPVRTRLMLPIQWTVND